MKIVRLLCSATLCSASMLLGTAYHPAQAAEGGAALGPLTFILVDLDLNDGIAPSIVFDGTSGSAIAPVAGAQITFGGSTQSFTFPTSTAPVPVDETATRATAELSALARFALDGRMSPTGAQLAAAVETQVLVANPGLHALARVAGDTGTTAFTLSANTALLLSVPYDVLLSTAPPPGAGERLEAGAAAVWLRSTGFQADYEEVRWLNHTPDGAGFLTLDLANRTGFSQTGGIAYGLELQVEAITPVPEPGMLPLLGAGFAVIGAMALAKRRRA